MNRVTVVKFISNVAYKKKYTLLTRKKNVNESFSFTYLGLKLKLFLMYVKHHNHIENKVLCNTIKSNYSVRNKPRC